MHGVGTAYDAIYSSISPGNRTKIAQGLASNGLAAFQQYHTSGWWWKTVFNCGGVCNGELLSQTRGTCLHNQVVDVPQTTESESDCAF
jgi:hypothetical protein